MKKTAITLASGLAASLLLASCSTPPGLPKTLPDTRASLPDTWNAPEVKGGAFSARSDWWNEFSDPTLSSLIETGLSRSHNVRAALARLEEARAYAEETGAALYPNISLGADASNGRTESATSGAYQKSKIHRVQGEAAWEIDFWGKNRKAREAALASADSSLWGSGRWSCHWPAISPASISDGSLLGRVSRFQRTLLRPWQRLSPLRKQNTGSARQPRST